MLFIDKVFKIKETLVTGNNRQEAIALCNELLNTVPTFDGQSKESFENALRWSLEQLGVKQINQLSERDLEELPLSDLTNMSLSSVNDLLKSLMKELKLSQKKVSAIQDDIKESLQARVENISEVQEVPAMLALTAWCALSALFTGLKEAGDEVEAEEKAEKAKTRRGLKLVH